MTPEVHRLHPGGVVWLSLDPVAGREQSGHRPAVVVSGQNYLDVVDTLAIIVPVTTVNRRWTNHVPVTGPHGLERPSWAMTEQPRVVSRERITSRAGQVDTACLTAITQWLADFLDLP